MTTSVMSAGDGYRYYTESVATADIQRTPGTPVTNYYTAEGNPPGVWMGRGSALLGLNGEVREDQMRALYGEGIHPEADAITAQMQQSGATTAEIQRAIKLGRSYYQFDTKDTTLRSAIDRAVDEHVRMTGDRPNRDEHRVIRMREGAIAFRDVHGRQPLDNEELAKYVTNAMKPAQHAMAGIDHTFSVPKSVSVLWALGGADAARDVETAHERAIERTLQRLETEALATRAGVNGTRQIDVQGGIIASRFRHFESRVGDPHLHDHVVISAKVLGSDGTWRSLDSRALLRSTVYLSETYNKTLFDELDKLGYRSIPRIVTEGKDPVLELDGVDPRLVTLFSKRSQGIKPVVDRLVKEYTEEHGRSPDSIALRKLSEQAWQETRPTKDHARSIAKLWSDTAHESEAHGLGESVQALRRLREQSPSPSETTGPLTPPLDVHAAAAEVMRNVEAARSTWGEHHVKAEIERYISHHRYRQFTIDEHGQPQPIDRQDVEHFLLRTALELDSISLTPDHVHGRFQPLTRSDGESFYTSQGRSFFTSTRVLDAEHRLLTAARSVVDGPAAVTPDTFARALAEHPNKDQSQVHLAREFVTSRSQILLGVGPAGAGKTRSMKLAAAAVELEGRRVIGLAPSKHAAKVFAGDVDVPAYTIDSFILAHHTAAERGVDVSARYAIAPGDVVIVDEAAMASTAHLDQVTQIVADANAYVRFVYDHAQISAVGAGGAARLLGREVGAIELQSVYRFADKHEREASLVLRESPASIDPFAWYKDNGRIIAGDKDRIAEVLFHDYLDDVDAGRDTIMGAPTRDYVDQLNSRAQAHAIADGRVTGEAAAPLNDGHQAHVGDRIMTRLNKRELTMNQGRDAVDNGDIFTVTAVHPDGSLTATHTQHHGTITLPADYVKKHTHLGYAFTAHQEQGNTVGGKNGHGQFVEGASRGIVNSRTARSIAYVLATRGVTDNVLYVEVEPGQHPDEVLAQIARNIDTNLSAHETIDVENERILDLPTLVDEHADIVKQANELRFEQLAARILPHDSESLTRSEAWDAAAAGLARAEKYGLDPADVLAETWSMRRFDDADDVGAVMSWRIERHLKNQVTEGAIEPLPDLGADTGRYEWAVDRTASTSPDLPDTWRNHLLEREHYLDERMTQRGVELTIEQPDWTDQLGPVPQDRAARARWMRLAAEVDLFRARYKVPADETAAVPDRLRGHEVGANLAARVTAMHKSTAIRAARGNDQVADPAEQLAAAEKIARRVDDQRPISDAEAIAATLDPSRRDALARRLDALRKKVDQAADKSAASEERNAERSTPAEVDQQNAPRRDLPDPATRIRGPRQ